MLLICMEIVFRLSQGMTPTSRTRHLFYGFAEVYSEAPEALKVLLT